MTTTAPNSPMARTHAMLSATAKPQARERQRDAQKNFQRRKTEQCRLFLQDGGNGVKGRDCAEDVIAHADVNLRDDKSGGAVGQAQIKMLKHRAERSIWAESQGEQDAERQRRKQNWYKQNGLPPEAFTRGAARNVCGDRRAHRDDDQHRNAGEQQRDADGRKRGAANIGAPLPWSDASQQRGERIEQRQRKQRRAAAGDPVAWNLMREVRTLRPADHSYSGGR